ncbi:MAG: TIGR03118 family protein [Alphaproteobacteria bacterium]|nr:TIGR03118 family protein [Alphaproteobacteria bacterium]
MKTKFSYIPAGAIIVALALGIASARADDRDDRDHQRDAYAVNPLVSDLSGAAVKDPVLQNAWGVAFTPGGSPFWISDNATGCATLYDGDGTIVPLQVAIPLPGNVVPNTDCKHANTNPPPAPTPAAPTGIVWNPTTAFLVPGTTVPAHFIFDTEDGTISAWASGTQATQAVDNSKNPTPATGAVYKSLAVSVNVHGVFLYAANFRAGTIDVFDTTFKPATTDGGFVDPNIPVGFAPFSIKNIDGELFVTYAKQNAQKHDDVAGPGNGFVDVYDTDGHLLRRFASRGPLNSPWGMTRASFAFGRFSGLILIGNFGDGRINVFDSRGHFIDQLEDAHGKPLVIDGLWTLTLGGGAKSSPDTLYFTAGPNGETDGLFGTITPISE